METSFCPCFVVQGRPGELEGRVWAEEGVVDELVWGVGQDVGVLDDALDLPDVLLYTHPY